MAMSKDKTKVKVKKQTEELKSWRDYSSSAFMFAFIFLVFAMRVGEEGFEFEDVRPDEGTNHYQVLQVPTTADTTEIRSSYKKLALKWHPDKNANCSVCMEKFNEIAASYEILNSPDRRTAYDEGRAETERTVARASTSITADNYASTVLTSNDVWVIQLFSNSDSASGQLHPIWEDISQKNQRVLKFGRIDVDKDKPCLKKIPIQQGFPPTIFMMAPKLGQSVVVPRFSTTRANSEITRFIYNNVPRTVQVLRTKDAVRDFFIPTDKVRVLLVGNLLKKQGFGLESRLMAYRWLEYTSVGFVSAKVFSSMVTPAHFEKWQVALPADSDAQEGILIATAGDLASLKTNATIVKQLPSLSSGIYDAVEDVVSELVETRVPFVTQTSLELLCQSRYTRRYCLFLTDSTVHDQVLQDLKASRRAYLDELGELRQNEDIMDVEEEFWIQPVYAGNLPDSLRKVDPSFFPPLASPAVLVEIETSRYAEITVKGFTELYQSVAYEDLKLEQIPEDWSLFKALVNPSEEVVTQVRYIFSSTTLLLAFVVVLVVLAVLLPEIDWNWWKLIILAALAFGAFLGVIPAGRRDVLRYVRKMVATE